MTRIVVLGTEIDAISFDEAIDRAFTEMKCRRGAYIVTPNSEMLLAAREDGELCDALRGAFLALPDGAGVVLASRILGTPLPGRIAGVDFARVLLARMGRTGGSLFLLGAAEGVAARAAGRITKAFPALSIAGVQNGFFTEEEERELIDRINTASPDLLIVCLGSPRQERWMAQNAPRLRVGLMAGLGGTLDLFAGRTRRAPRWMRTLGLEWLFRLLGEPWRARRISRIPRLFWIAFRCRIGGRQRDGKRKTDRA